MAEVSFYSTDGADDRFASKSVQDEVETGRLSEGGLNATITEIAEGVVPEGVITAVVDYGTDLNTSRPDTAGVVQWQGAGGYPVHRAAGDIVYVRNVPPVPGWSPSPSTLPGLTMLFDAQELILTDMQEVTSWADMSGNSRPALSRAPESAPSYRAAAIGGLPGVQFDGADDYLSTDVFDTYTGAWTIYCVAVSLPLVTTGDDTFFCGKPVASTTSRLSFDRRSAGSLRVSQGSGSELESPASLTDTDPHIYKIVVNGVSSSISIDGTAVATGTLALSSRDVNQMFLGGRANGTNFLDGLLGTVAFVQGTVSPANDTEMMTYLNERWWLS